MSVKAISGRYAKSLLDEAIERKSLEKVKDDIALFQETLENRDLYLMLKSPIIQPGKKKTVMHKIFGDRMEAITMKFIDIILTKGREPLLPEIAEAFMSQYREHKNITTVVLKTAVQLDEKEVDRIRQRIEEELGKDQTVEIQPVVVPGLIGGFILEIGHQHYDASVAHQLEELKKEFK